LRLGGGDRRLDGGLARGPGSGGQMAGVAIAGLAQNATPRSPRRSARRREIALESTDTSRNVMARSAAFDAKQHRPLLQRGGCRSNAGTSSGIIWKGCLSIV
jgi:hypothetical protein